MFKRAAQPCDLHLFAETDHFMFAESNTRVRTVIYDWLDKYFPVQARRGGGVISMSGHARYSIAAMTRVHARRAASPAAFRTPMRRSPPSR